MLTARELLRRPAVNYQQVEQLALLTQRGSEVDADTDLVRVEQEDAFEVEIISLTLPSLSVEVASEVELQVKYESYVRKQEQQVYRSRRLEEHSIPETIDYAAIPHLRIQARQKLAHQRPRTLGQASRVEGVSPADLAILMVYLEKMRVSARTSA